MSPYSHPSTKPTITLDNFQGNVLINDASIGMKKIDMQAYK